MKRKTENIQHENKENKKRNNNLQERKRKFTTN